MVIHPVAFEFESFGSKIIYCIAVRRESVPLGKSIGHGEIRFVCI